MIFRGIERQRIFTDAKDCWEFICRLAKPQIDYTVETPNLGVSTNTNGGNTNGNGGNVNADDGNTNTNGVSTNGLYKNKYRIASTRLKHWDYSSNAAYFVTICTQNKICYFGDVLDDEMRLSEIGIIADKYWREISEHFPFVKLDAFVVMPNHVHGILIIDNDHVNTVETPKLGVSTNGNGENANTNGVSTNADDGNAGNLNHKWKPGILGGIINQYKRICTIHARKTNPDFVWQSRFYDHIIRNEKSYLRISEYVINNPFKWQDDEHYE